MRIAVCRGCSQGSVLSLLLWCLVVDVLIARLTGGGLFIQGYVDDIHSGGKIRKHGVRAHAMGPPWCRDKLRRGTVVGLSWQNWACCINKEKETLWFLWTTLFLGYSKLLYVGQGSEGSPGFSSDLEETCGCQGEEGWQSLVDLLEVLWCDVGSET